MNDKPNPDLVALIAAILEAGDVAAGNECPMEVNIERAMDIIKTSHKICSGEWLP